MPLMRWNYGVARESFDVPPEKIGKLPLEHLRAVVLTQAWAGAFTTMLLADMGAEVIQIEALDRPDPWRGGYPPRLSGTYPDNQPGDRPYNRNANFNSVNTNKYGITLDLNYPEGKEMLLELVSISDIFAENFSARVIPNFKLEYPVLKQVNPSLIMLRMPSYGCDGPYSMYMGNGGTTEPMSGLSSLLGYEDEPPMNSGIMHTDPVAGLYGLGSLLIALHHRNRTGQGQLIDLSQQETSVHLMANQVMDHMMNGTNDRRQGNRHDQMAPHGNFECDGNDSWVAIAVRSDQEWQRLCGVMGKPELAGEHRFGSLSGRLVNVDELEQLVTRWTKERKAKDIMTVLQAEGIPCSPVHTAHEVMANPHLAERGFFQQVEHPETGTFHHAGTPWRLSRSPVRTRTAAPALGQHSGQILGSLLGVSAEGFLSMVERGITGDTPCLDD